MTQFEEFVQVIRRLRSPGGCPWDREQTHESLKPECIEEAAEVCHLTPEAYQKLETGAVDIPVGVLQSMAKKYGFELTTLISGDEPHRHNYFVTKKDQGLSIERRRDYKY